MNEGSKRDRSAAVSPILAFEEGYGRFPIRHIQTANGRTLEVRPGHLCYNLFDPAVSQDEPVFAISELTSIGDGWFQVSNVGPQDVGDFEDYVGVGVGEKLYDFVEEDLRSVGCKGLMPDFGNLSPHAEKFWRKRIVNKYAFTDDTKLQIILGWHLYDLESGAFQDQRTRSRQIFLTEIVQHKK